MGETGQHGRGEEGSGRGRLDNPPEGFLCYHIEMSPFSKRTELPPPGRFAEREKMCDIIYKISVIKKWASKVGHF
jgi:hypothetical protein